MEKERVFVVVLGKDQKGIIAQVSGLLFKHGANIEDVQQKVMDGTFVMTMLADITESSSGSAGLRDALENLAESLGLKVMLHNEAVIKAMHRI
ncbi:MAG: ACT domain-containing protein [Deltaproteobacteria bacterium]|nr:ACT domain-containing protein [Deltaproteobacteria bacterium]